MLEKKDGKVELLQTDVDKDGNVKFINVLETSGFKILDDISIETLKTWKFKPAKLGNKFVDDIVDIPVKFVLTLNILFKPDFGVPYGIRTRVAAVKGRCPEPLDEGDKHLKFFYKLIYI